MMENGAKVALRMLKTRDILAVLDAAVGLDDYEHSWLPAASARGKPPGFWATSVSGNWRVTFRFDNGHAADVDYMDYH